MDNAREMLAICSEIDRLESDADHVMRAAMSKLFREEPDVRNLIKLKAIYEILETVTDRCEDVANIVEGIIVKVDRDEVLLDIGYKTEGILPLTAFQGIAVAVGDNVRVPPVVSDTATVNWVGANKVTTTGAVALSAPSETVSVTVTRPPLPDAGSPIPGVSLVHV